MHPLWSKVSLNMSTNSTSEYGTKTGAELLEEPRSVIGSGEIDTSAVLPSGSKRDRKQAPLANLKSLGKPEREEKEEEEEEVSSPVVRVLPICVFENFLE